MTFRTKLNKIMQSYNRERPDMFIVPVSDRCEDNIEDHIQHSSGI